MRIEKSNRSISSRPVPYHERAAFSVSLVIFATDTFYGDNDTRIAGVLFSNWEGNEPASTEIQTHKGAAASYDPGAFYRRELPFIISLLDSLQETPSSIIIDGYVFLDGEGRKGLGAHLFDALQGNTPVIGVAKKPFAGSPHAIAVKRGASKHPFYVTAAGILQEEAGENVLRMAGGHRIPMLLKLVDRLCREGRSPDGAVA